MKKNMIFGPGPISKALQQTLSVVGKPYELTHSLEEVEAAAQNNSLDSLLFVASENREERAKGNELQKRAVNYPFVWIVTPETESIGYSLRGEKVKPHLADILQKLQHRSNLNPILVKDYGFAFEADSKGLTQVLLDQFSEPLLCFRELVQNSVDANASRIDIKSGYDKSKEMLRVGVYDDGSGMTLPHIKTYLTLFDSTKDTDIKKIGQMGAGKVFAHVLKPKLMTVTTGNGCEGHRVIFQPDMSGSIISIKPYKGTAVELFLPMKVHKARAFNKNLDSVVTDWCKYIKTPLHINDREVNQPFDLKGEFVERIQKEGLEAVIGFSQKKYSLFKGGILLENEAYVPAEEYEKGNLFRIFGGLIDARTFEFPISRNGVVQNSEFKNILNTIKEEIVQRFTPQFSSEIAKNKGRRFNSSFDDYFYHLIANNGYGFLSKEKNEEIKNLPIIENIDGDRLSVTQVRSRTGKTLYYTNQGLSSTEVSAFLHKGIPVLLHPNDLLTRNIFSDLSKQCLDERYYRGASLREIGRFNFSAIENLLSKDFISKVSGGSLGGGFGGLNINQDGTFDNPFDFSKIRVYGADFKNLDGTPEQNLLLDTQSPEYFRGPTSVIFNVNHPFMRDMDHLAQRDSRLAQFYIACELVKSKKVFSDISYKIREHEMARIGLKAVDYD